MTRQASGPTGRGSLRFNGGHYPATGWQPPEVPNATPAQVEDARAFIDRHAHDEQDAAELRRMLGIGVQS